MFKDVLKVLRTNAGLTQEELAKKLGLGKSAISMYESGSREPNLETLEAIADTFNVDMNTLIDSKSLQNGKTSVIDPLQEQLLRNYQQLNTVGREKLLEYSDDLLNSEKYTELPNAKKRA